ALLSAFILYIYAIILLGSVVKVWGVNNEFTLENYEYVFTFGMKAIKDTLLIAVIGTPLGGLLAVVVGYVTTRLRVRGSKLLETVSLLNYTLPGTVVGIAYVLAFNSEPIVLTGTIYILIAAYVFRYSSAGIRNVIATLTQIDPSIEEASRSLGASSVRTFFSITVPMVLPAVLAGMRYLFIHSMTAISATIFLVSVQWSLITTRILECMTELQFAQACAFSIVLIILIFIASGVMALLARLFCRSGDAIGVH
ncbi:MAG: ABC transporter permease subunit, partial [Mesosutterella sp.]|nr:ABC transporter permease subunit [Mesosutterella sp.]